MMIRITPLILFLFLVVPVFSQSSSELVDKYYLVKNYTTKDGLVNNEVIAIEQDKQGYIWFGTRVGISRFDGRAFNNKLIPAIYQNFSTASTLEKDNNGNLIATALMQGVFLEQNDGSFKHCADFPLRIGQNAYSSARCLPDGTILVGGGSSISKIVGDSIKDIDDFGGDFILFETLQLDKQQNIWFGGVKGAGILQLADTNSKLLFISELKNKWVWSILFDDQGNLHVASTQGYYRIEFEQPFRWGGKYRVVQPFEELKDVSVRNVYIDQEKNVWMCTMPDGVYRTKGDSITLHLTDKNGLASSSVLSMLQDHEGNYWFGTFNGLSKIENFENYSISSDGERFNEADCMRMDDFGRIWMCCRNSLGVYRDGSLSLLDKKGTPLGKGGVIDVVIDDKSTLWIVNDLGLFSLPLTKQLPELKKAKPEADFSGYDIRMIHSIRWDESGIWITTRNKIYLYQNKRLYPVRFNHADSSRMVPKSMQRDSWGNYWIGDFTYGLYRAKLEKAKDGSMMLNHVKVYRSQNADSSFVTIWIFQIKADNKSNTLWMASYYTGIYKLTLDSTGVKSYKLYSTRNGLSSNMVLGVSFDEEGRIWAASQQGMDVMKLVSGDSVQIDRLGQENGIEGQAYDFLQEKGKLYVLTDEGIFITKDHLFSDKKAVLPKVTISGFTVNGRPNSSFLNKANNIGLSHEENNVVIEFSAITFKNAESILYQYKLEGIDKNWSVLSARNFVEYPSLPPGNYTFKVRASRGDENFSDETTLSFRIYPVFYRTAWFYLLIGLGALGVFYWFYRYRIRQVIKMERLRTHIAADLHDDIGSTLSSISLMSEMARSKGQQAKLAEVLGKIGDNSREVLNSMDDIIWSVNPQDDSLSSLIVRLREYAIPVCESKGIDLCMDVEEVANSARLEMEERRNIFLIVKEAVNNAAKYSGCTMLSIRFTINYKHLEVSITDNGCGFDPQAPTSRNGVANMERRATLIGGQLTITSGKDAGTTILLKTKNHMLI